MLIIYVKSEYEWKISHGIVFRHSRFRLRETLE